MLNRRVEVGTPTVHDTTIEIGINASPRMQPFITSDTFFADYSTAVEEVPESILSIPVVANLAPVCWATDADLIIESLDTRFRRSLRDVQQAFRELYPIMRTTGKTWVRDVSSPPDDHASGEDSGLLFSGGADSLASLIRHHEELSTLFTVRGADIDLDHDDAWDRTKSQVSECATAFDLDNYYIETNFQTFINQGKLSALFGDQITDSGWWGGVQHGIGLLSLCAPAAYEQGLSDLYIAASYTDDFGHPWGSHPTTDSKMAWSETDSHHDGFSLSRQQKLALIVDAVKEQDADLPIRACWKSTNGENCGRCEKCCRSIAGLMVAGVDPAEYGFPIAEDFFEYVCAQFENDEWSFGFDEVYMWSNIRQHTPAPETVDDPETAAFYQWLRAIDPEDYRDSSQRGVKQTARDTLIGALPYRYYDVISLLYSRVKAVKSPFHEQL